MTKITINKKLLTNPDKVLFPQDGITKAELAGYYESIAPFMLPYLKEHPVTMMRFPEGIDHEGFYQKNIPDYFPQWIARVPIINTDGTKTTYVLCENKDTLIYLAYQATVTIHTMLSRADKLHYPDKMVFDLDPGEHTTFEMIRATALLIKKILDDRGIVSFAMTTGSRGIHVVAPLKRMKDFDFVHRYSHAIAQELADQHPNELTVEIRKEDRKGRMFIDAMRNTYGHLAVAPYSVRAHPGAPVATPISWQEVYDPQLSSQSYTIKNIQAHLKKASYAWKDYPHTKNTLK